MSKNEVDVNSIINQVLDEYCMVKGFNFILDVICNLITHKKRKKYYADLALKKYLRVQLEYRSRNELKEKFGNNEGFKCIRLVSDADVVNEDDYGTGIYLLVDYGTGKDIYCYKHNELYFNGKMLGLTKEIEEYKKLCKEKFDDTKNFVGFFDYNGVFRIRGEKFKPTRKKTVAQRERDEYAMELFGKPADEVTFEDLGIK